MSRPTRWFLVCPDCGRQWAEVVGRLRWRALGPWNPEHPAPAGLTRYPGYPRSITLTPGWELPADQWIAAGPQQLAEPWERPGRSITRTLRCFECFDRFERRRYGVLIDSPGSVRLFMRQVAKATQTNIDFRIRQPPDAQGRKECVLCHRRFSAARSDACYCSTACRKAMHRRLAKWRSGEALSHAIQEHDRDRRRI